MTNQPKRPLTAADLYDFTLLSEPQLSPDGAHVVYALRRVDKTTQKLSSNLWVVSTADGTARQFTYGDQVDRTPRWSPDGRTIAFLSNRADERQYQFYLLPLAGGEARPLTKLEGSIGRYRWSPAGSHLVCTFRQRDAEALEREQDEQKKKLGIVARHITRLVYKEDEGGSLPQERWQLWTIDAASGEAAQLTASDRYDAYDPAWSPNGRQIVFRSNRSADPDLNWDQQDLFLYNLDDGQVRRLETPSGPKSDPVFSPDGAWIAYFSHGSRQERWQQTNLWLVPAAGPGTARNLTAAHDLDLQHCTLNDMSGSSAMPPVWRNDGQALYVQVSRHGRTGLQAISVEDGAMQAVVDTAGVVGAFGFDRNQEALVYALDTPTDPAQIWGKDLSSGESRPLTTPNRELLAMLELGEIEAVWYQGPAGNRLQGWILKPSGFDPGRQYPAILEIHGGPMTQYGFAFMHEFYYLAGHGYVVFFTNPRGGRGYGVDHTRAIYHNWGGADYDDVMAWTDWVAALPYVDETRLGVTGGSYGGYLTNWIIGHTDRFKAAVTQRSVSNFISMLGSSDLAGRWPALFGAEGLPWENMESYWRQSPLKYFGNVKTPTLVIHSEEDLRCNIEQGEQVFVALKLLGMETEMVRFPGEPHGLSRAGRTDRRIARLEHILRWFDRYLK